MLAIMEVWVLKAEMDLVLSRIIGGEEPLIRC
jgi:hypothetical protein